MTNDFYFKTRYVPFSSTIKQWYPLEGVSHLGAAIECVAAILDHLKSFTLLVVLSSKALLRILALFKDELYMSCLP